MNNKIFNTNSNFEMIDETDYEELIKQEDRCIKIGDVNSLYEISSKKSQGGFATGFVLGISAGIAFVICIVILYLVGIINL